MSIKHAVLETENNKLERSLDHRFQNNIVNKQNPKLYYIDHHKFQMSIDAIP